MSYFMLNLMHANILMIGKTYIGRPVLSVYYIVMNSACNALDKIVIFIVKTFIFLSSPLDIESCYDSPLQFTE